MTCVSDIGPRWRRRLARDFNTHALARSVLPKLKRGHPSRGKGCYVGGLRIQRRAKLEWRGFGEMPALLWLARLKRIPPLNTWTWWRNRAHILEGLQS